MRRLFREVDADGNGKVDFEEFLALVRQRSNKASQKGKKMLEQKKLSIFLLTGVGQGEEPKFGDIPQV